MKKPRALQPSPPLSYLEELRPAFVAHLADRLNNTICAETQAYADRLGVRAPVKTHSAVLFLYRRGTGTLSDIARTDGQSHQLLAARLAPLEELGFIERCDDPDDGRRQPYRLTPEGRKEARRVEAVDRLIAEAMRRLFEEIDQDLIAVLEDAIEGLRMRPLGQRLEEIAGEKAYARRTG